MGVGAGIPSVFVSVSAAALGEVDPDQAGIASGVVRASQWIGGALGLALVAAVSGGVDAGASESESLHGHVHSGFLVCTVLSVLALFAACLGVMRVRRLAPAAA